jgi:hypothetical protein
MEANILNVKDLPQAQEVLPGDFIILEDNTGTKIVDFRNFVVGPRNTSFYNALVTNINTVSTYGIRLSGALENTTANTIKAVRTEFKQLTAAFSALNPTWYISRQSLQMPPNSKVATVQFFSPLSKISMTDINVVQIPSPNNNPYVNPVVGRVDIQELIYDETGTRLLGYVWNLGLTAANITTTGSSYAIKVQVPYVLGSLATI